MTVNFSEEQTDGLGGIGEHLLTREIVVKLDAYANVGTASQSNLLHQMAAVATVGGQLGKLCLGLGDSGVNRRHRRTARVGGSVDRETLDVGVGVNGGSRSHRVGQLILVPATEGGFSEAGVATQFTVAVGATAGSSGDVDLLLARLLGGFGGGGGSGGGHLSTFGQLGEAEGETGSLEGTQVFRSQVVGQRVVRLDQTEQVGDGLETAVHLHDFW